MSVPIHLPVILSSVKATVSTLLMPQLGTVTKQQPTARLLYLVEVHLHRQPDNLFSVASVPKPKMVVPQIRPTGYMDRLPARHTQLVISALVRSNIFSQMNVALGSGIWSIMKILLVSQPFQNISYNAQVMVISPSQPQLQHLHFGIVILPQQIIILTFHVTMQLLRLMRHRSPVVFAPKMPTAAP